MASLPESARGSDYIALTEAAKFLQIKGVGIGYANTYDYYIRGRLVGRRFKRQGRRRGGVYVTIASVRALRDELAERGGLS